jgi:uncharacterized membrane protein YkoI
MKSKYPTYVALTLTALVLSASVAIAYPGEDLAKQARITMDQAAAIAQHARPGTVTDKELEREAGGSGLRYSFDVAAHGRTYEIGVDAVTGKVLENRPEGKNPD